MCRESNWWLWRHHGSGPSTLQSIASYPNSKSASFALLKHWLPRKGDLVFVAPRGLGWLEQKILCRDDDEPINAVLVFSVAGLPQSKNTTPFLVPSLNCRLSTALMIASVNSSQPFFLWLCAWPFRTVKTLLINNTPCFAHRSRFPWLGIELKLSILGSFLSSL